MNKAYAKGTHRTCPPEDTLARLKPLMGMFGITRVANLTGLDRLGVPVVMVCRPNARSSAVFHGKGIDLASAKASGVMEAIETWHAEQPQLPLRLGSYSELRQRRRMADVYRLSRTPADRFHADLPMLWAEGTDLFNGEQVLVPFEIVHANATLCEQPGVGCFPASTNGLASGNAFLEAVVHALCEVIERDATSIWHRARPAAQDRCRVALDSVSAETCRLVLDQLERAGVEVAVWDVTTDVGVAAFQCLIDDRSQEPAHVGHGAGCHPAREIAFLRALTEAVQVRMTYIVGSREDIEHADYLDSTLQARRRSARELIHRPVAKARDFEAAPHRAFESFEADVSWLLERLRAASVREAVAIDLSRAETGVSVVRVVVPGLEGSDHHADYSPGPRARAASGAGT